MQANNARKTEAVTYSNANNLEKPSFFELAINTLAKFPGRSQDIIMKRYGLKEEKGHTLEKIGREFNITRERVRQIITDVVKSIREKNKDPHFLKAEEFLVFTIEKNNGIIKESEIDEVFELLDTKEKNAVRFFAYSSKRIKIAQDKDIIEKAWLSSLETMEKIKVVHEKALEVFKRNEKPLSDAQILGEVSILASHLSKQEIESYIKVLKKVKKNKLGKWGMHDWKEINPKGTREKVFLVLKEANKPLHFTEIASLIDKYKLSKRKAHPQTVHNELIKDERFVLIGRGIYALKEWGYPQGTIKELVKDILKKNKRPMKKEEIIDDILKIRKVKKMTVMINLNNSNLFKRHNEYYSLKNSSR
jgi:hypothetical protein